MLYLTCRVSLVSKKGLLNCLKRLLLCFRSLKPKTLYANPVVVRQGLRVRISNKLPGEAWFTDHTEWWDQRRQLVKSWFRPLQEASCFPLGEPLVGNVSWNVGLSTQQWMMLSPPHKNTSWASKRKEVQDTGVYVTKTGFSAGCLSQTILASVRASLAGRASYTLPPIKAQILYFL